MQPKRAVVAFVDEVSTSTFEKRRWRSASVDIVFRNRFELIAYGRPQRETVVIPSLDRLSCDVRIEENLFWRFEQFGVRVLIADMPHYDHRNRRDVLIRQTREAIAEDGRKEIIESLLRGRCVIIHSKEAMMVRFIFDLADKRIKVRERREFLCKEKPAEFGNRQAMQPRFRHSGMSRMECGVPMTAIETE